MSDLSVTFEVPTLLLAKFTTITSAYNTDVGSELVNIMECFVDSYEKLAASCKDEVILKGVN